MKKLIPVFCLLLCCSAFGQPMKRQSVGSLHVPRGSAAPMTLNQLAATGSTANTTSYASASHTPTANALVIAAVISTKATAADTPTLSGNGITWVYITNVLTFSTTINISVFRGRNASPSAGATTATYGASQTGCYIKIVEFVNADPTGTDGDAAIVQCAVITDPVDPGTGTANPSLTLSALSGGGANAVIAFSGSSLNPYAGTSEGTWTEELDTGFGLPTTGVYATYQLASTDNTVVITAGIARWGLVALEIKAQ